MRPAWAVGVLGIMAMFGLPTPSAASPTPLEAPPAAVLVEGEGDSDPTLGPNNEPLYSLGHPLPHANPSSVPELDDVSCEPLEHCSGHGECYSGSCLCEDGYVGDKCQTAACPNDCSGKGWCDDGVCVCRPGRGGADCSQVTCLNQCSGHGQCLQAECFCQLEWAGEDCSTPRYGTPGLGRPKPYGLAELVRLNDTHVAARVPASLLSGGKQAAVAAALGWTNDESCVKLGGIDAMRAWNAGEIAAQGIAEAVNVGGDTVVGPVVDGCSVVTLDVTYSPRSPGEDDAFEFRTALPGGTVLPSPLPPPPPPKKFVGNEVPLSNCVKQCSGIGTCWNNTREDDWAPRFECVCPAPYTPPCCCSVDPSPPSGPANETQATDDDKNKGWDPLDDVFGTTEYNKVPCSADDQCAACTEAFVPAVGWVGLAMDGSGEASCAWVQGRRCATLDDRALTCRSPGLPPTAPTQEDLTASQA